MSEDIIIVLMHTGVIVKLRQFYKNSHTSDSNHRQVNTGFCEEHDHIYKFENEAEDYL